MARWCQWSIVALLAVTVVTAKLPDGPRYLHVLHKAGHPVAFGVIAWLLDAELAQAFQLRAWKRAALAFIAAIAIGGATELVQVLMDRGASWLDVGRDAVGVVAALALRAAMTQPSRIRWSAFAVAVFAACVPLLHCAAAYTNRALSFPVLFEPRSRLDDYFVAPGHAQLVKREGRAGVRVEPVGDTCAFYLDEPSTDWRGYSHLVVELVNPHDVVLPVTLRIHDVKHSWAVSDRYNGRFVLAPRAHQVLRVPLRDVAAAPQGRAMDLAQVAGVAIFATEPAPVREFDIVRIGLE